MTDVFIFISLIGVLYQSDFYFNLKLTEVDMQ